MVNIDVVLEQSPGIKFGNNTIGSETQVQAANLARRFREKSWV